MIRISLLFLLLFFILQSVDFAQKSYHDSKVKNIVFLLDRLCIQNKDDYSEIDYLVESFGGKDVTAEVLNLEPMLRNGAGKALKFKHEGVIYMVSYVLDGTCILGTKNIYADPLSRLVKKNYKARVVGTTEIGAQQSVIYGVGVKESEGDLIVINSARENLDHSAGSIGYIPKKVKDRVLMNKLKKIRRYLFKKAS
ncbi:hypothetical protein [Halodesulfovibrio sp.]|jgi:hypothetical protein|uniref:hypothetical protein n=1 Tax=Halodesulfovibrio sp. TaxID=1912772 RepID=UPI0025D6A8E1|nr:hypothetical protein [Halodesulfovibrio sp.]MCT4536024.1 hypothetical protein [Halodesulfovibrio sp.]